MFRVTILVFAVLLALASATQVNRCNGGDKYEDRNQVQISGCEEPPCKLKRKTQTTIIQKFVPEKDVESLVTSVNAAILGVPLPFIGVDGMSACDNIFNTDGTKAGCSLKKGVEYTYKNTFPIQALYPRVSMIVHYALVEGNNVIACFEVPSKITN